MSAKLFVVSLLVALLVGCSQKKEDNTAPIQAISECILLSESLNDKPYRTYEYTQDNRLFRINQHDALVSTKIQKRYTFDYDQSNQVSAFRETNLLAPFINFQYNLHYDAQNRIDTLRQYRVTNKGLELLQAYAFTYDDKNRLTKYSWGSNYWRYEYDDANNVIKWIVKSGDGQDQLVAEYGNFDVRKNVYSGTEAAQLINLVEGGGMSPYNPGSFKIYDMNPQPLQTGIITYLYNEHNLPVEASVSTFSTVGNSSTLVYEYAYKCL